MPSPEEASTSVSPSPGPDAGPAPTFKSLGLIDPLLEAVETLNFKEPTEIQAAEIGRAHV